MRFPLRRISGVLEVQSRMVEGGLFPAEPTTTTSTFLRFFTTSSEVRAGVAPRWFAEVRRRGPVSGRSWAKSGWFGIRIPTELKWLK